MATGNNRDVKLTLGVETTGAEEIQKLAGDLEGVATAGKDAAPGVEKLAAELAALELKTKELRATESAARSEVALQKTARAEQRDALARLRVETDAAGRSTDQYKATEAALRLGLIDSGAAIRAKQAALEQATTSARVAAAEEAKLATQILVAGNAAKKQAADVETGLTRVGASGTGMADMLRTLGPLMAATFSAQQFVATITAAESLSRSYEQIFGSTAKARAEMEFIKVTSNKLGLETLDLAKSYQSLSASTKGTVLEGQQTRDVFEAVARAMSTLGKSSAEADRALVAISQMASKGTVSMEELRGQLGEALPGAMKAAADGAGLTVEQLVQMVSTGDVLAKDMLPALTKGLNDLYANAAPPATVISEWARFKNVVTETSIAIGEGGASKGIAQGLTGLATVAKYTALGVDILGTSIGEGAAALVTWNGTLTTSQDLAAKYGILTVDAEKALAQATVATKELAAAQTTAGASQEDLNKKQADAAESALKIKQRYVELAKGSADYIAQVEKEVVARTAETTILTQLVNVYGTEIEKRQMLVGVSETQAAAANKLASAHNTEALIAASYAIKLREMALATGDVTEATKKQIEEAQKSATAKQTEAERTIALAKAKGIEVEASKAQAQALQDNSSRVGEYRAAVDAARIEVERLTAAHKTGKATDDQVTNGKAKLAAATLLYRDALADTAKNAELNIATQQRAGQLTQAAIGVDMERAKAALEVASAQGDSAKATQLATQMTGLQVQASQAQADAARSEAAAIRAGADAKEAELKARGELTTAAKAEIDARRQAANMKDLDGEKSDILTNKILALAKATESSGRSTTNASGYMDVFARSALAATTALEAKNAAIERGISAQEKANDLAQRAIDLENKRLNRDAEGWSIDPKTGKRIEAEVQTDRTLYSNAKSQGLTEAQSLQIVNQFMQNGKQVGYGGSMTYGDGNGGETWQSRVQKAIDSMVMQNAKTAANTANTGTPGLPTTAATTTVNVNIGGRTTAVGVASQSDANSLTSILRQLESASGVSS